MKNLIAVISILVAPIVLANNVFVNDRSFVDENGRERFFRGFNVSGTVKLSENGFLPFRSQKDADYSLSLMKQKTGANLIRLTVGWEGFHPAVDEFDTNYANEVLGYVKLAASKGIYVLLDYHTDIYSRHLFGKKNRYVGNGAPKWITPAEEFQPARCLPICFHWTQNGLTNKVVRKAFRYFWKNQVIQTSNGKRRVQDEFLWQLEKFLLHLDRGLSKDEKKFILGLDPYNEPMDGGMEGLKPRQWERKYLWPFYFRVRQVMDKVGWTDRPVFAEPLVFWNVKIWPFVMPTGKGHVRSLERNRFVFNSHIYDPIRQGIALRSARSGEYAHEIFDMREESNRLNVPVFVSEFGAPITGKRGKDPNHILKAFFQGFENFSDKKDIHFESPYISFTQWHWDIYKDDHKTEGGDGWNDEDFSVIADRGERYTLSEGVIQRAYPRAVDGHLHFFHSSHKVKNKKQKTQSWSRWSGLGVPQNWLKQAVLFAYTPSERKSFSEFYIPSQFSKKLAMVTGTDSIVLSQGETREIKGCSVKLEAEGEGMILKTWCQNALIISVFPYENVKNGFEAYHENLQELLYKALSRKFHPVRLK